MTEAARRRVRRRAIRRWLGPAIAGLSLIVGLGLVVRRSEEGRRLSRELSSLEGEERLVRDRLASAEARVDSLTSLRRIERAATELGLRQAGDGEVFYLTDGDGVGGDDVSSGADQER